MDQSPSNATEPAEIVIRPEQWARLSETERDEFQKKLEEILGRPVVIRIGTPPPGAIKFGADGSIERVRDEPPDE